MCIRDSPYSAQVVVNSFEESPEIVKIQADVFVMRDSQKGIIIGKGGGALRQLGTEARKAIEKFVNNKVFLDLKVKVDEDWRCLLYTSPSPRDRTRSRMPSSA